MRQDDAGKPKRQPRTACEEARIKITEAKDRAARLKALKESIRSGAYAPDIKDVAYLLATMMTPRQ